MKHYHRVLTIAGSDSGGGAGIQADIKTIQSLGCYATSAVTAITVQNTMGVKSVFGVPADVVAGQIDAVLEDIGADAIKIGMLQSADIVECIVQRLRTYNINNVVIDPVMLSTSGHRLIEEKAIEALENDLIPLARVITPNIPEAELLLGGRKLSEAECLPDSARALSEKYGVSVLLKSGHLDAEKLVDYFYDAEQHVTIELPSVRVHTKNTHGTGCTMSSAFASCLAKGMSLQDAARGAKKYINDAIIGGAEYEIGHGHGPVLFELKNWKIEELKN